MRVILLFMQRRAVAQGIVHALRGAQGVRLIHESDYEKAAELVNRYDAGTALIEISETGLYDERYCLELCSRLRKVKADCRLIQLCPEQDEAYVEATVKAMQNRQIDDFLFYDASMDYITAKLLSE